MSLVDRMLSLDRRWIFLIGLREALHNMVMAFVIECIVTLVATVGGYRQARAAEEQPAGAAAAVRVNAAERDLGTSTSLPGTVPPRPRKP